MVWIFSYLLIFFSHLIDLFIYYLFLREADEKVQIEKQLALKKASLQSHAASLWAPQLESLHKNFKEKLSTIEKEQANSIEKLKIKLEKENFNELTKETNDINKEYYDKINKIEDENKKMLEEYERKYEEEIKNLKIKHENEKDLITQQFDRYFFFFLE